MTIEDWWQPGDQIVMRSVWGEKIAVAWPMTVIEDSPGRLVLYLAEGTRYKLRRFDPSAGFRLPIGDWTLSDDLWRVDLIRIMRDGDDHAYLGFWSEDGTFSRWYINMEQHYRRTSIGIDFVDHFLDVVIDGNLTGWRWKDEDELAAAASTGLITRQAADAIRAEGRRAITRLKAHAPPFNEGWEKWKPNPEWSISELPSTWQIQVVPSRQ